MNAGGSYPLIEIILPRHGLVRWQLEVAECLCSSWPGGAAVRLADAASPALRRWPASRLAGLEEKVLPPTLPIAEDSDEPLRRILIDLSGTRPAVGEAGAEDCRRLRLWSLDGDLAGQAIPFLAEISAGAPVTSVMLALDTPGAAGPTSIVGVGWWRTLPERYVSYVDRLLHELPGALLRTLLAFGWGDTFELRPVPDDATPVAVSSRASGGVDSLKALAAISGGLFRRAWNDLFRHEQWTIGISEAPIEAFLDPGPAPDMRWWQPGSRAIYLADPFGITCERGCRVLAEQFDYRVGRGTIVELDADSGVHHVEEALTSLQLPTHLSYPYVFRHEDAILAVPENFESNTISLYRLSGARPFQWEPAGILVEDFAGVDATLFDWQGRWWMLATDRDAGADSHLHAWHARSPFGPWEPHPLNPVKIDVRGARPGGTPFVHEGRLFRPVQDCSRTYGGRIVLMEITRLDPETFLERPVGVVCPDERTPWRDGLHTLSACGDGRTLLDAKRIVFSPWACYRAARNMAGQLGGLLRR
jgi:hypothetical protein